jgi:hypothetical protein
MRTLTLTEKTGVVMVPLAIIAIIVSVTVPEFRRFLRLDNPKAATTLKPVPAQVSTPKAEQSPVEPQSEPPKPRKKKTTSQSSTTAVQGNGNTAGNNVLGDNNVTGNGNTVNSPSTTIIGNASSVNQQGGVTAGNVFITQPMPNISWSPYTPKPGEDPNVKINLPRAYAKIYLTASLPDAKFAIVCTVPCQAAFHSSLTGVNADQPFKMNNLPAIAGIWIKQPNPFPGDTNYVLGVESMDEQPVSITGIKYWNFTDAQKKPVARACLTVIHGSGVRHAESSQ